MIILDTDHLGILQLQKSEASRRLQERLIAAGEELATTIVSAEEEMRGWLAVIHRTSDPLKQISSYQRLARLFEFFSSWKVLNLDEDAAQEFHRLRAAGLRIGSMDLKIACIAKGHQALLLSRNLRDFLQVPDLRVEDWVS